MYSFLGHTSTHTNFAEFLFIIYFFTRQNFTKYMVSTIKAHRWCSDIITVDSVLLLGQYRSYKKNNGLNEKNVVYNCGNGGTKSNFLNKILSCRPMLWEPH